MATYISLLRAINVGGQKKIPMDALKKLYASLNLKKVKTYIQSGNVVFQSPAIKEETIEKAIQKHFGFDVAVLIRTPEELKKIIAKNPFAKKDSGRIYVVFLSDVPKKIPLDKINSMRHPSEEFFISGKEIYLFYPNGYGRTKLSNTFFEKTLNVTATTRNWNTVTALMHIAE
ncbi:DUF1697 domain-containing protein [Candidatus Woesearchaeota archaeon]|nr:MAG: DUF1697 domain-containing protein [Candidatus Woesearchaeota archaeon]